MNDRRMNKKKLCLMGLDEQTSEKEVRALCQQFSDFYRTKNNNLAFAEYNNEA